MCRPPFPTLGLTILQLRSVFTGIAMVAVMHIYFKFTQPLFMQALMGLKNLYDAKPVHVYIFGKPATGDLKRPWKAAALFGGAYPRFQLFFQLTKIV